jgi:hypothetical protein
MITLEISGEGSPVFTIAVRGSTVPFNYKYRLCEVKLYIPNPS